MTLKPEFWAERSREWHLHFVTMAKRLPNGQILHRQVPVLPVEYLKNPTEWPRGTTGKFELIG